jgi:hypothetical protein
MNTVSPKRKKGQRHFLSPLPHACDPSPTTARMRDRRGSLHRGVHSSRPSLAWRHRTRPIPLCSAPRTPSVAPAAHHSCSYSVVADPRARLAVPTATSSPVPLLVLWAPCLTRRRRQPLPVQGEATGPGRKPSGLTFCYGCGAPMQVAEDVALGYNACCKRTF